MLAFFNNYSSGLTYYYFLSNLITLVQNLIIREYFVDEEALLKQLNEKAAKHGSSTSNTKKKMSFTERIMQKQRELERLQKQQNKNRKKK
jgi:YidC/Oxa1 family membrane protein insertase